VKVRRRRRRRGVGCFTSCGGGRGGNSEGKVSVDGRKEEEEVEKLTSPT